MTPSRRQFVAAVAAVPFVSQIASAQRRPPAPAAGDPVFEQIIAELRALGSEFEKAQPGQRKSVLRAMESTLGAGAAHLQAHYDAGLGAAIRRRENRLGRATLVQELVDRSHGSSQPATPDVVDAALNRLARQGLSGTFRDIQQTIRKIRLQSPEQIQAAAIRSVQYDYCADLNWMISNMEGITLVVCGIAGLEPTPGGEIACAALTLALGLLYVQRTWFC